MRVPKTGIWESILTWVEYKQKEERDKETARQVRDVARRSGLRHCLLIGISTYAWKTIEQETQMLEPQTLKMILLWIRSGGKEALKQAEFDLEKRSVKPTGIIQHIEHCCWS